MALNTWQRHQHASPSVELCKPYFGVYQEVDLSATYSGRAIDGVTDGYGLVSPALPVPCGSSPTTPFMLTLTTSYLDGVLVYSKSLPDRTLLEDGGSFADKDLMSLLRTKADCLILHACVLRGETTRQAELSEFFMLPLENEPQDCWSLALRVHAGRTIPLKDGVSNRKTHYMGAQRHKYAHMCPVGALAAWLSYRWHVMREDVPNFNDRSSWYHMKFLVTRCRTTNPMSSQTQNNWINRVLAKARVTTTKVSHAMRKS